MKFASQIFKSGQMLPNANAPFGFALKRKLMVVCVCVCARVSADSGVNGGRRLEKRAQTIIKTIP